MTGTASTRSAPSTIRSCRGPGRECVIACVLRTPKEGIRRSIPRAKRYGHLTAMALLSAPTSPDPGVGREDLLGQRLCVVLTVSIQRRFHLDPQLHQRRGPEPPPEGGEEQYLAALWELAFPARVFDPTS